MSAGIEQQIGSNVAFSAMYLPNLVRQFYRHGQSFRHSGRLQPVLLYGASQRELAWRRRKSDLRVVRPQSQQVGSGQQLRDICFEIRQADRGLPGRRFDAARLRLRHALIAGGVNIGNTNGITSSQSSLLRGGFSAAALSVQSAVSISSPGEVPGLLQVFRGA